MAKTGITEKDLDDLRSSVGGVVTTAADLGYDQARKVWNSMIDARPSVIVQAASAADLAPTIAFSRRLGLDLAVRGGGHNVAGKGTVDGGVVLDLRGMTGVHVDPAWRTVRVEGGATLKHVDAATARHGLVVPLGVVSATGVAGLTLGGGVGWLTRKHGLTADNLVSATVVTAEGRKVTASTQDNPDLLWALRGGGGNFGVVSEFTFQAHRLGPDVFTATLVYRLPKWRAAWRALAEWTAEVPEEMTTIATTLAPRPAMQLGEEPVLIVRCVWASNDTTAGKARVDRLRQLLTPDSEVVGPTPWVGWQTASDPLVPHGVRAYWRNTSFDRLDEDVIDVLVSRGTEQTWTGTAFDVHHMGGAFSRIGTQSSPFPARASRFWLNIYGFWREAANDEARIRFVRGMSAGMNRFSSGGTYVNFHADEDGRRGLDAVDLFGPDVAARLAAVKRRFDPDNVFHINQNILPS